jgi:hypothetical protein
MTKDRMGNQEKKACKDAGGRTHLPLRKVERIAERRRLRDMPGGAAALAAAIQKRQPPLFRGPHDDPALTF